MPRISIIIPTYNHASELAATLESLRQQTVQDFEVIVVDDGSTDDTAKRYSSYPVPFSYRFIHFDQNRGAPQARNEGFRNSSGQFVMFLDADVVLIPEALKKMLFTLEAKPEASFVYPSFHWGNKLFRGRVFDPAALKEANYIHTSALLRREAFPGFDESLKKFQDWDLFLAMSEQGRVGVWIDEPLYRISPRKHGISRWLPSFMYRLPWFVIGWQPRVIRGYREAERLIRQKYNLSGAEREPMTIPWLLIIVAYELATLSIFAPVWRDALALVLAVVMFFIAWKRPVFGLSLIAMEFVIGGKGRGLAFGADSVNDGGVSLRILIFAGFLAGWFVQALEKKRLSTWHQFIRERWALLALFFVVLFSFAYGFWKDNPFLIPDANAWGVLLLAWPIWELATAYPKKFRSYLVGACLTALSWLTLKTFVLFYLFSHNFESLREITYLWVRRTGVGEITPLAGGAAARLFFQSHIYALLGSVLILPGLIGTRFSKYRLVGLSLLFAVLIISLSRSFWLSLAIGGIFLIVSILRRKTWKVKDKLTALWRLSSRASISALGAFVLVIFLLWFPVRLTQSTNILDPLFGRIASGEAGAVSRWSMLPVLWNKITESPLIGHGFGSVVTYVSSDPRIVAATGGSYTTYAFEWGWLDLWIKLGLPGLFVMLWLLVDIARRVRSTNLSWEWKLGILSSIFVLASVHVFTPYLNHPLGLFYLMLIDAMLAPTHTSN